MVNPKEMKGAMRGRFLPLIKKLIDDMVSKLAK
jgi:hypothetical protein